MCVHDTVPCTVHNDDDDGGGCKCTLIPIFPIELPSTVISIEIVNVDGFYIIHTQTHTHTHINTHALMLLVCNAYSYIQLRCFVFAYILVE